MSRTGLIMLGTALATVLAWLQLAGLPAAPRLWAAVLLVPLPVLMIVQARLLDSAELPRVPAYISSILSLWLLAFITAAVAWTAGLGPPDIGVRALPATDGLLAATLLVAAGVGVLFAFSIAGVRETTVLRALLPVSATERLLFVAVSVTAGVCEEFIFRGFLLYTLVQATGSPAVAVIVSSGAFGVLHAYQRPAGVLRSALIGVLFAIAVIATGSIWPAIIAHALVDLLSGLWLHRYLLR